MFVYYILILVHTQLYYSANLQPLYVLHVDFYTINYILLNDYSITYDLYTAENTTVNNYCYYCKHP